jgi:hypothetical protein
VGAACVAAYSDLVSRPRVSEVLPAAQRVSEVLPAAQQLGAGDKHRLWGREVHPPCHDWLFGTRMQDDTCEACGGRRPPRDSLAEGEPCEGGVTSASGSGDGASSSGIINGSAAAEKGGKKKKLPKFERLRVTGGDGAATEVHRRTDTPTDMVREAGRPPIQ